MAWFLFELKETFNNLETTAANSASSSDLVYSQFQDNTDMQINEIDKRKELCPIVGYVRDKVRDCQAGAPQVTAGVLLALRRLLDGLVHLFAVPDFRHVVRNRTVSHTTCFR